jgi:hypothetical protein
VGANNSLGIDIQKNGGASIFPADKPFLASGQNKSTTVNAPVALTPDDYLKVTITGTGLGAEYLVVSINYN